MDELAHSNLTGGEPPPRHPKRWQDVEELLEAGIDVWTTVNVQHLESLNDLIVQTTGVQQRETLPDHVFDKADEVELIDLPPDDLLARLRAGKIYLHEDAANAVERFFRKPNLMALREIALRRVADRVEAAARDSADSERAPRSRLASDRVLVATGPDAQSEQLIRVGKRLADALDADWTVVYVETPALLKLSEAQRNRRIELLRLGESLGAETVTLDGPTAVEALLEYAATRHVTRMIVGSPKRHGWRALLRQSTATELPSERAASMSSRSRRTESNTTEAARGPRGSERLGTPVRWSRYVWAVLLTALCTLAAFVMYPHVDTVNILMVYLLGVTVAGLRLGRGPSVLTSVLSVASFDYFSSPALQFRGVGCAVSDHFRGDAADLAGHRHTDGQRASADPGVGCARTTHLTLVCDEPRTRGDPWDREHVPGRSAACGGGISMQGCRPAAGCHRSLALSIRRAG